MKGVARVRIAFSPRFHPIGLSGNDSEPAAAAATRIAIAHFFAFANQQAVDKSIRAIQGAYDGAAMHKKAA
jgi:hypothetical protein